MYECIYTYVCILYTLCINYIKVCFSLPLIQLKANVSASLTTNAYDADFFYVPIYTAALIYDEPYSNDAKKSLITLIREGLSYLRSTGYLNSVTSNRHLFFFPHLFQECPDLKELLGEFIILGQEINHCFRHDRQILIPYDVRLPKRFDSQLSTQPRKKGAIFRGKHSVDFMLQNVFEDFDSEEETGEQEVKMEGDARTLVEPHDTPFLVLGETPNYLVSFMISTCLLL